MQAAHAHGRSIEAEVGSIGGVEDGVVGSGEIADPEEPVLALTTREELVSAAYAITGARAASRTPTTPTVLSVRCLHRSVSSSSRRTPTTT